MEARLPADGPIFTDMVLTHPSKLGIDPLRPARKKEKQRWGAAVLKKIRQLIESINDTLKGHLDLEQHGGQTIEGVAVPSRRTLAMSASIWHNLHADQPTSGSLITYDHRSRNHSSRCAHRQPVALRPRPAP
jgi:hypothetical protein